MGIKFSSGMFLSPNHFKALKQDMKVLPINYDYGVIDYSINSIELSKGVLLLDYIDVLFPNGDRIITKLSNKFKLSNEETGRIIYCFVEDFHSSSTEELNDHGSLVLLEYENPVIGFSYESYGNKIPICQIGFLEGRFQLLNFIPPLLKINQTLKDKLNEFYKFLLNLHNIFIAEYDEFLLYLITKTLLSIDNIVNPYNLYISILDIYAFSIKEKLSSYKYDHNNIFLSFDNLFKSVYSFFEFRSISNKVKNFNKLNEVFVIDLSSQIKNFIKIIIDTTLNISDIQKWVNEAKIASSSKWDEVNRKVITGASKDYIQVLGGRYVFHIQMHPYILPGEELRIYHPDSSNINYILLAEKLNN